MRSVLVLTLAAACGGAPRGEAAPPAPAPVPVTRAKAPPRHTVSAQEAAALLLEAMQRHVAAQQARQTAADARKLYAQAAQAYQRYLDVAPEGADVYEALYFMGETYFFGEDYAHAVDAYRRVVSLPDDKYREDALASIGEALGRELDAAYASGAIAEPAKMPPSAGRPSELAPLEVELVHAADNLARDPLLKGPRGQAWALRAALLLYRHLHFEEALARFRAIAAEDCNTAAGADAARAILQILAARKDPELAKVYDKLSKCGAP